MSKEIWLGPLLGNNRSRLIERCATLVSQNQSHKFLYLAASHPLLELVTQGILDGTRNRGVWGELPVYLFRGFVRRILSTAVDESGQSLSPRVAIDQDELPLKRSLVSQILNRLTNSQQLRAIGPLANREGCVNSIASLIGEIERAAKSPEEVAAIVAERAAQQTAESAKDGLSRQIDFDREVSLIYSAYCDVLERNLLTEADADQRRALAALKGEVAGKQIQIPWLPDVELLVLDGFFDFTPVQGEILHRLIPSIPDVVVNLNHDERNPDIFLPFEQTIQQLESIDSFSRRDPSQSDDEEVIRVSGALASLRERLFNSSLKIPTTAAPDEASQSEIRYFECGDRDTEIRAIAKEVKRLIFTEGFSLAEVALVVRQRAVYAETIARVMREESVPCNFETRIEATDIPANRAALKLLSMLEELAHEESNNPRTSELADLIKSEYFQLDEENLAELSKRFDTDHATLLINEGESPTAEQLQTRKRRHRVGLWDADALENAFAYVGSDLRVSEWLKRAQTLVQELPNAAATKELLNINGGEQARDPDEADLVENAETAKVDDAEKKRRPSRDLHPAMIAWTAMVLRRFTGMVQSVPRAGAPKDLRAALIRLLEQFRFRDQIARPIRNSLADSELPQAILNFNSLENLRRSFAGAIKSIEFTARTDFSLFRSSNASDNKDETVNIDLATFIDEVRRCLSSQTLPLGGADRGGLRVLEATDVRGLRFRAVFVAGLIEGGFPLRASRDWIYPHEERERLKQYGLTLEDISPATLLKEEHYFYQSACRATEKLFLTRPLVLEDDSETVASYYLDELRRAIAPVQMPSESIRRDYEGKNVMSASRTTELNVGLVRQQERDWHAGGQQPLLTQSRIRRFLTLSRNDSFLSKSALRRIEIGRERASSFFGPYDGEITDERLLALIKQRFGEDYVHSASGLSTYANCAFRFFGQRVLKLQPRGEAALDLRAIDAGKLLHDILRRFFEQHRREPIYRLDRAALQAELRALADSVFDEHEGVVPPLNKSIWRIDREIRKILLDQVLLYEIKIQEDAAVHGSLPAYFEVAFGGVKSEARDPSSKEEPLQVTRNTFVGEEVLKVSGQIDRVDISSDNTIIAYDYKLSTGATREDIRSGRSLQLPIYLEALEKLILPDHPIAGGGYYIIRGGNERRNRGLHRADALHYSGIGSRTGAVVSEDEWHQIRRDVIAKVWNFLDHMRAGNFTVNPAQKQKSCRFCDFVAVCRYDRYRIDNKEKAEV